MQAEFLSFIILPAAMQATGNAVAPSITGNPGDVGANTFSIPLSPAGTAPATYYACCTAVDSSMLAIMQQGLEAGAWPGALYYRTNMDGYLVATSSSTTGILNTLWTVENSLMDAQLSVVSPASPA